MECCELPFAVAFICIRGAADVVSHAQLANGCSVSSNGRGAVTSQKSQPYMCLGKSGAEV